MLHSTQQMLKQETSGVWQQRLGPQLAAQCHIPTILCHLLLTAVPNRRHITTYAAGIVLKLADDSHRPASAADSYLCVRAVTGAGDS